MCVCVWCVCVCVCVCGVCVYVCVGDDCRFLCWAAFGEYSFVYRLIAGIVHVHVRFYFGR